MRLQDNLKTKQVFIFDWDGTVFDSMEIKFQNFCDTTCAYLADKYNSSVTFDFINEIYKTNSGHPRLEIYEKVGQKLELKLSIEDKNELSLALTNKNTVDLSSQKLFVDAEGLIIKLLKLQKNIFISSSVPQIELDVLTKLVLPEAIYGRINGIYGSDKNFSKGVQHLARIAELTRASKKQCLVIGDDYADYERSLSAGVDCILVDRGQLIEVKNKYVLKRSVIVNSLDEITKCIT